MGLETPVMCLRDSVAKVLTPIADAVPGVRQVFVSPCGKHFVVLGKGRTMALEGITAELTSVAQSTIFPQGGPIITGELLKCQKAPRGWIGILDEYQ